MWTDSNQKRGYMVVTVHYIYDSWNLCNKILRFMYVPAPHNAKTLSKELMGCLVTWSIECKLSTLTLDNCSVNFSMIDKMKEKLSGGRHVTPHRNRLHPDTLQALICTQDGSKLCGF
ncbi:unnamed protein product [Lactuca virosa]|uniref:Uncharacterized protein n=1 Tax=Lactuca virosa TaxID=75947 RepID=A0AAU9LFA0_9ASTR|nr:unnamed protein product [Lactuca virosa]